MQDHITVTEKRRQEGAADDVIGTQLDARAFERAVVGEGTSGVAVTPPQGIEVKGLGYRDLVPGEYIRHWGGYACRVVVYQDVEFSGLTERILDAPYAGLRQQPENMPHAVWVPVEKTATATEVAAPGENAGTEPVPLPAVERGDELQSVKQQIGSIFTTRALCHGWLKDRQELLSAKFIYLTPEEVMKRAADEVEAEGMEIACRLLAEAGLRKVEGGLA